jgi:hypothetical protein
MHFAHHHAIAPGAEFGGGGLLRRGGKGEAGARVHLADRLAFEPFERDSEQDKVDAGVRRGHRVPAILQHKVAQKP